MVRTGELRAAVWSEFDFEDRLLHIPGHKMKMGRDHLVPLSRQAVKILNGLPRRH
ncbi:MAG: tyrosine-type recombinase/integrase [Desulfovibrio sp.]|jgi:integrase|nr:tyrosine-type recombinase/integrase [Desulfovibrio sp.]